jgi:Lipopolysaccharide-assembly
MVDSSDALVFSRRRVLGTLFAGGVGLLGGCGWDGHFSIFGYTTRPNYDESIRTVYVPLFQNKAFTTSPYRGIEKEITRAVIREIEAKTPYKAVSDCERADTELLGTLIIINKVLLNRNQLNEVREFELQLSAEVVWRDLRDGGILTNRRHRQGTPDLSLPPFDPNLPPPPEGPERPFPVLVQSTGRGLPEAGESNTTAEQMAVNRLAQQIVNLMERPWTLDQAH